jgi:hypothetical protein
MNKELLISELKRYIKFCNKTKLTQEDGINCAGHKDFDKYEPGTPGIHPYWDDEMESIQMAEGLLYWAQNGTIPHNPNLYGNAFQCKINLIHYIELNPQFTNLIIGECGRGIEALLALSVRDDWESIVCFDFRLVYKNLVEGFFGDDKVIFLEQQSCFFDFDLLEKDSYMLVLTHSLPHSLKHFIGNPKIGMIIKEGVLVDQTKHWREHKPEETYNSVFENLQNMIETTLKVPEVKMPELIIPKQPGMLNKFYKKIRGIDE